LSVAAPIAEITDSGNSLHKLPRRDWLIIPLLVLLTVGFMFLISEAATRLIWREGGVDTCRVRDPIIGWRNKPNCAFAMKAPEGPWVHYKFNNCGYRNSAPCGPKQPGSVRIALLGSSTDEGYLIPYEQTFAVQASEGLGSLCKRPVEVQNMGTVGCTPIYSYRRIDEALALKPDAIVLAIAPFDVQQDIDPQLLAMRKSRVLPGTEIDGMGQLPAYRPQKRLPESRTILIAKHFFYQDSQTYVKLYLLQGDPAGFLREPLTAAWEKRFSNLDLLLGEMADKIHAAGVPFVLAGLPEHAQVALLGLGNLPPGVQPRAFDARLAQIASKHGIIYIDLLDDFARVPHPEKLFYPADGHLAPAGHVIVGRALMRRVRDGIPALSACVASEPKG